MRDPVAEENKPGSIITQTNSVSFQSTKKNEYLFRLPLLTRIPSTVSKVADYP
jgi:hypothetical protein